MYTSRCLNIGKYQTLERAGVFVIGQSHLSRQNVTFQQNEKSIYFDERDSFVGSLFNFNIWDLTQSAEEIYRIYSDCGIKYCGNAVKWSDLWQGIRGDLKMIWPAGFFRNSNFF
jgi:hypothetical protein